MYRIVAGSLHIEYQPHAVYQQMHRASPYRNTLQSISNKTPIVNDLYRKGTKIYRSVIQ